MEWKGKGNISTTSVYSSDRYTLEIESTSRPRLAVGISDEQVDAPLLRTVCQNHSDCLPTIRDWR